MIRAALLRALYRIGMTAAMPLVVMRLLWRARHQPAYLRGWGERFAITTPRGEQGAIWIHAVSVGETRAAEPLIKLLRERHPDLPVLLTCMTPTGRDTARQLFGNTVQLRYLPYDRRAWVRRFLRTHRPRMGILMETELWPELMLACRESGVPLYVVNGRLSARSARRYGYARALVAQSLGCVQAVAAQGSDDAERFRSLGARAVQTCGNLKFDRGPGSKDLELGELLRSRLRGRPMILLASSREGEERLVLDAWRAAQAGNAILTIVPRHPQRFDEVAALIRQWGLRCQRRSDQAMVAPETQVWLGDSMGEMYGYYQASDVALIGGSFLELGGQNLLEGCAVGKPVLFGPYMFNFVEAAQWVRQAGAGAQTADASGAIIEALRLLDDAPRRLAMGAAGRALMAAHRGATARVVQLLGL